MTDLDYLHTYGCQAAGCLDEAYRSRGKHAPNCTQSEIDLLLDEKKRLETAVAAKDDQIAHLLGQNERMADQLSAALLKLREHDAQHGRNWKVKR